MEEKLSTAHDGVSQQTLANGATASLVGDSPAMVQLRSAITRVASHRSTVLILGGSGTGKELVAQALHQASPRAAKRFVAVNCAAIAPNLLEAELFGHVRGAFTDAAKDRDGLFAEADGGTIFLDEIGEIPLQLQPKLLRVLQESEVRPVGATASTIVDVRVIAATLRDLAEDVAAGRFREDLYYRLNVVPIAVPSLDERRADIPLLVNEFASRQRIKHQRDLTWPANVLHFLSTLHWPGNVRELENLVERVTVLCEGAEVTEAFVLSLISPKNHADPSQDLLRDQYSIKKATRLLEADLIRRALDKTAGNRTNAAKLLEISHRALLYKLKEYGIH